MKSNMSNWDDEDWDNSEVAAGNAAEPVGDWDDEEEVEEPEPELKKPSAPMKPKKALERALKAKEEEERQREVERIKAREEELAAMTDSERKARQQELVEQADLENAVDLFSGGAYKAGVVPRMQNVSVESLEKFQPVSDADYKKFAQMIGNRCAVLNDNPRKTGQYMDFLKQVMRIVTKDLGPDDAKDLSTFMGLLSNEKRDEFKKAKGIKKKVNKKANVRVDRASDIQNDDFDDYADDFM